jgi:CheY-like chemotaxis protein
MMPDMSGTDFIISQRRSRELAEIPVVIVSADHRVSDAARSLAVDGFVQKPIDLNWLIETVERHCPQATVH